MEELNRELAKILEQKPHRMVFSALRDKSAALRRATAVRRERGWQIERLSTTQAFHENVADDGALLKKAAQLLRDEFMQLVAFGEGREYSLRVTKKGKILAASRATKGPKAGGPPPAHDRQKQYLLPEGVAIAPLVDIGVLTQDGRVVAAMRDKYRQINRFVQLVQDVLEDPLPKELRVVDFGCGVSYLTFVLYHYLAEMKGIQVDMTGVDRRAELLDVCAPAAQKYGYAGLHFTACDIAEYDPKEGADMVVSLHACDTATDLTLARAVQWGARYIFSVPCCQHEANAQMKSDAYSILTRYGIIKERTAALMTDAIRANLLTACGYKTQLVEFVGFEHTPKNIMIRAVKTGQPKAVRQKAMDEVQRLCDAFSLSPCLLGLLKKQGAL